MAAEQLPKNSARTTLAEDLDDTETVWTVTDGSVFPSVGQFRVRADSEIALCTSRSTNDLTVVRGVEGTVAAAHSNGAAIRGPLTEQGLENLLWQQPALVLDLGREVMNFPSLEKADGAQPLWWTELDGNATLTEEDGAGESLTETYHTRVLKLVTAASAKYAYQRFTYADQPRVKSGRLAAVQVAVWSVSSAAARIRLRSSSGVLGTSVDTTAASWTILTLEPVTLNGTYVQLELEVDSGTAYFIPLTPMSRGLTPRRILNPVVVEVLSGQASKAVADLDLTSNTSNLTAMVELAIHMAEFTSGEMYKFYCRMNGSSEAVTGDSQVLRGRVAGADSSTCINNFLELCDEGQLVETAMVRDAGAGTILFCELNLLGYWEWE